MSKSDMMISYVWHSFCTYCVKRCLLHYSVIMSHSALSVTTVLEARPKLKTKTPPYYVDEDYPTGSGITEPLPERSI